MSSLPVAQGYSVSIATNLHHHVTDSQASVAERTLMTMGQNGEILK